jgi:PAS domain S-box-containing protein
MLEALWKLFSSDGYMPHGMCLLWNPALLELHIWSDALIGLSYFSMPAALVYFARRRSDFTFRWVLVLFGIFILACGTTHFFSIWTIWHPDYVLDGTIKAVTAAASIPTAILLWVIMPEALALPNTEQLQALNNRLQQQVEERERSEIALSETNRKLMATAEKLERSEREAQSLSGRLALGTEAGGIAVWDYDIRSETMWSDERMLELFDMGAQDMPDYRRWIARLHPEDQEGCATAFQHSISSGVPFAGEFRIILTDGSIRTIRSNGKVFLENAGRPFRMAGISYDVTDLRQRELDTARRAAERFERVVEAAPNAMVLVNGTGIIEMVNTEAEHLFGYSRGELLGHPVETLLPDRFKLHHPGLRASFSGDPTSRPMGAGRDLFGRHKDGNEFPVEIGLNPIETDEGSLVLSAIVDISERQRATEELKQRALALDAEVTQRRNAEVALRESSEGFQYLFQNNPLPMWVYDIQTLSFLEVNRSAILSYGFTREEFLAMTIADIRPTEDVGILHRNVAAETAVYQASSNWRHRRKDGEVLTVDIFSHHISFEGKAARLIVALDVTLRNRAEEQLRQAQKMDAIGQLTGGVAHDFNNLLAIIQGNLELMLTKPSLGSDMVEMAGDALGAAERGAKLTQQLLAYSRQQPLSPQVISLNDNLLDLFALLRRTLEESIQIDGVIATDLWEVRIDKTQLDNALLNLAINARDAMPHGGKLTIEASNTILDAHYAEQNPDVKDGSYVMLVITDTGEGMSADTVARVFEPFFTTKPLGRGTGLGLSMVYGFVKQSGGHIKIYSELGHGTSVKMYLPRFRSANEEGSAANRDTEVQGASNREVVLVVEDDAAVRKLTVRLLTGLGYQTIEAEDGVSALAKLETTPHVDLLFTDVVMPKGMNGRDLARKAQARRPSLKVLYMSGYTRNAILHNGELDEGVHLLTKPFHLAELAQKVKAALRDGVPE